MRSLNVYAISTLSLYEYIFEALFSLRDINKVLTSNIVLLKHCKTCFLTIPNNKYGFIIQYKKCTTLASACFQIVFYHF